jgi:hypothetical protein
MAYTKERFRLVHLTKNYQYQYYQNLKTLGVEAYDGSHEFETLYSLCIFSSVLYLIASRYYESDLTTVQNEVRHLDN